MYITGTGIPANTYITSAYVPGSTSVPISNPTTASSSGSYTFSYAGSYVPVQTYQVITSAVQEFVIAFGSNPYLTTSTSSFNPLLVRWSDQANPYQWVPQTTNQDRKSTRLNSSHT